MPVVVSISNPLRCDEREVAVAETGTRVGDLKPADWGAASVRVNGIPESDEYRLREDDMVVVFRVPEDLLTAAFVAQNLLISIAVSAAFALLFPAPKSKLDRDDESSAVYGFEGISNDRAEGNPLPVIYGTMKVGGTVINEFVSVAGFPPKSTLRQLIGFGEGPITSIAGVGTDTPATVPLTGGAVPNQIFINGNNAQNTPDLNVWLRMGENEQESVPGFNETRVTFPVESDLTVPEEDFGNFSAAQTASLITGFSVAGDDEFTSVNDALWQESAVTFDFSTEEVDGFVWTLSFPGGFYATNTASGGTESAFLGYQIRYIELDNSGNPIASGGYNGDGYVRLPVVLPIALAQREGFQIQDSYRFEDPQISTPAIPGNKALTTSASGSSLSYAQSSGGYSPGSEIPFFSFFGWVNFARGGSQEIFSHTSAGAGFRLYVREVTFTTASNFNATVPVLTLDITRGSDVYRYCAGSARTFPQQGFTVQTPDSPPPTAQQGRIDSSAVGQWLHIGASFRTGQTTISESVAIFVNGQSVSLSPDSPTFLWTSTQINCRWASGPLIFGNTGGATAGAELSLDEWKCYNRRVDQAFAAAEYNSGAGLPGLVAGNGPFMCFRAPFQDATGTSFYSTAEEWWAAAPTLGASATSGVAGGVVRSGAAGVYKRSRWRVQILRTTKRSNRASIANAVEVQAISSILSQNFTYPTTPILGIEVDSSEQLNGGIPTTTAIVQGRPVPIWDGISTTLPTVVMAFSSNPAWVSLDIVTNRRYGLGRFYDLEDVDLEQWKAWADYCDEIVFDGRPRTTITNPGTVSNADVYFDNTTADPESGEVRGAIWFEIGIEELSVLPDSWQAGSFLRFAGFPDESATGVSNDINSAAGAGYEIIDAQLLDGVWTVKCYWDRMTETDPWTSGQRLGADVLTPTDLNGATVEGGQRRFSFNGVFDKTGSAWDALLDVCAVGRATPVPVGSSLSVRFSRPRQPIGVLTASNILDGSFEVDYSSERTRPNALTLSILDEAQGFETVPVQVQSSDLDNVTNQSFIRQQNETLFGVTDVGQAERHGNFILNTNKLQRRSGRFSAAMDALPYQVGDLLRVSSDVLPRGDSGRCLSASASSEVSALQDRRDFTGGAWTASSVTVTANTGSDPFGGSTADTIDGAGYVEQTLAFTDNRDGWVSVSLCAEQILDAEPRIELVTDRATTGVTFDLAALTSAADDSFDQPTRGQVQDIGGSNRYLAASFFVKAPDGRERTSSMALRIYPRAGVASGSARFSFASVTQAERAALPVPSRGIVLDRSATIAASTNYTVIVQDSRGNTASGNLDTTLTPPGTYPPGSALFTSASLNTVPVRGSSYIVASAAEQLTIEVSGVSRKKDMSADFEWVEYREAIYDDDATEDDSGGSIVDQLDQRPAQNLQPTAPAIAAATDGNTEPTPGAFQLVMTVFWQNDLTTAATQIGSRVFWRVYQTETSAQGAWTIGADVTGLGATASWTLPGALVGQLIETSVVPVTSSFPAQPPQGGSRYVHRVSGLSYRPEAPTALTAEVEDLLATYSADFAEANGGEQRRRVLTVETRRGGWILGQRVAETGEGQTATVTPDLFVPVSDASVGRLHARSRARSGTYSAEATVDPGFVVPVAAYQGVNFALGSTATWETYSGGSWYPGVPDVDGPAVSGALVENAAGELAFTGSGLVGTYITRWDNTTLLDQSSQAPRQLLVTAAVEAEQVHPRTLGEMQLPLGSLELQRWSLEGPTEVAAQDPANSALRIQIQTNVDGTSSGWSDWQPFACGIYTAVMVRLRLLVTRPDATYNVRIKRFHTNVIVPRRSNVEQGPTELHSRNELF